MILNDSAMCTRPLQLRPDGGFRILEIHGSEVNSENAERIRAQFARVLDDVEPDFVFLTGDNVDAPHDLETFKEEAGVLAGLLEEKNIPWSHIFGDMDRRGGLDVQAQQQVYQGYRHCLFIPGPDSLDGESNYIIPVNDQNGSPAFVLWGMDTGCEIGEYEKKYGSPTRARLASPIYTEHYMDGIHMNQTMWYWHTSQEMEVEYGRKIPGLMFFHVSTVEHTIIAMNQGQTHMTGVQTGQVVCPVVCGGIWSAVFERKDVQGIYCGHNRKDKNNFVGDYGGVRLGLSASFKDGAEYIRVFDYRDGHFSGSF